MGRTKKRMLTALAAVMALCVTASAQSDVARLSARLSSPDAETRAAAACALGRLEASASSAVPRLIELLADGAPVRKTCGQESPFEDEGWAPEIEGVKETTVGEAATQALMAVGTADDALVGALTGAPDWRARKNAAWALAHRGDARAMREMLKALRDADWRVRVEAAYALFQRGGDDKDVVEGLAAAAASDEVWQVRRQAVFALGHKGSSRTDVTAPLLRALGEDADARVRAEAAGALWHTADSRSFPALIAALKDDDRGVRERVADTLGNRADNEEVPVLIAALKDPDGRVREGARRALKVVKFRSQGRVTNLRPLPAGVID